MAFSVCFDVIGTCFDFEVPIKAIRDRLGAELSTAKSDPRALFFLWFYAAQRDFTYISLVDSYKPIAEVLKATFRRACLIVDLPAGAVSDEDVAAIMEAFKNISPRTGLKKCFDGLRDAGWDVYAVTNGGVETSLAYYHKANIDLDESHLLSCDSLKIAKPEKRVYEHAQTYLTKRGLGEKSEGQRWFVAAHAWDLIAAREAGFKTAYLDFEEHEPVRDLFGEFGLYAESMEELLRKMKEIE